MSRYHITFTSSGNNKIAVKQSSLAKQLAWATDDVTDDITASLATFTAEEAAEYREETVLSCSSTAEAAGLPMLVGFLLLVGGGRPHGIHFHGTSGLFNSRLLLVLHVWGRGSGKVEVLIRRSRRDRKSVV